MKIQYIKHSGFLVDLTNVTFIFDYFEGDFDLLDTKKEIYFFVSHKHQDHFSFRIFEYAKQYKNITFVLSNDIKMNDKYMDRHGIPLEAREKIRYVRKSEELSLSENLMVKTLTSTDEGVAFLITYKEARRELPIKIYHAGDLNLWTWHGETKEEYDDMARRFMAEMKKIEGCRFDYAFVPLDPRQEDRFWWGFDTFMRKTDTSKVFPMHCWEDYGVIPKLLAMEEAKEYKDKVVIIDHCGQTFIED